MRFSKSLLKSSSIVSHQFIKNANVPSCKDCIHRIPYYGNYESSLNKCSKFGEKNIISNEVFYSYADTCRGDENRCGFNGRYFKEDKDVHFKIMKYHAVNNLPFLFVFGAVGTWSFVFFIMIQ
jgi:hypothetical protein